MANVCVIVINCYIEIIMSKKTPEKIQEEIFTVRHEHRNEFIDEFKSRTVRVLTAWICADIVDGKKVSSNIENLSKKAFQKKFEATLELTLFQDSDTFKSIANKLSSEEVQDLKQEVGKIMSQALSDTIREEQKNIDSELQKLVDEHLAEKLLDYGDSYLNKIGDIAHHGSAVGGTIKKVSIDGKNNSRIEIDLNTEARISCPSTVYVISQQSVEHFNCIFNDKILNKKTNETT